MVLGREARLYDTISATPSYPLPLHSVLLSPATAYVAVDLL
jgi:hypothetical protein